VDGETAVSVRDAGGDRPPVWRYHSAVPGAAWPALPAGGGASLLALQFQLDRTQWLPQSRLRQLQARQLQVLVRHARETVPYYRDRWRGIAEPVAVEDLAALPLLARRELREHFEDLRSLRVPPDHGGVGEARTSGSTGAPVRVLTTALTRFFWAAFTLREHYWHHRDPQGKLAAIRQGAKPDRSAGWGAATDTVGRTGGAVTFPVGADVAEQWRWLERERPRYLLTHPTNLAALAQFCLRQGTRLPGLHEARTSGETLAEETRRLAREAWDVPVVDMYSANEVGYIALQCPEHEHYHVQSEGIVVEVLDDRGRPCEPGGIGRVIVTSLHNFALPLVRYEIGDYAEVGQPCPCGRGLPVLARILGRVRNMLVTADGRRYWPSFGTRLLGERFPVLQHQFVQKAYDLVEARLVLGRPLAPQEEADLGRHLLSRLPQGFRLRFVYVDGIARGAGGKYEDFVSEVAG
jgi:phenylacetate-CoA ligase